MIVGEVCLDVVPTSFLTCDQSSLLTKLTEVYDNGGFLEGLFLADNGVQRKPVPVLVDPQVFTLYQIRVFCGLF